MTYDDAQYGGHRQDDPITVRPDAEGSVIIPGERDTYHDGADGASQGHSRQPDEIVAPASSIGRNGARNGADGEDDAIDLSADAPAVWDTVDFAELDIFVDPSTVEIPIPNSGGKVIVIKRVLDYGEQSTLDNISIRGIQQRDVNQIAAEGGQTVLLDLARQRLYTIAHRLVGWNITDRRGRPVKLPRTTEERIRLFRRMHPMWGAMIHDLIVKKVAEIEGDIKRVERVETMNLGLMPDGEARDPEDADPKLLRSGR